MDDSFEILSHTADAGVRIRARTRRGLYEQAATAILSLMFDLTPLSPTTTVRVEVAGEDDQELMVAWLSELLYVIEVRDLAPCRIDVVELDDTSLAAIVGGAPIDQAELIGPPIKAITYHDLEVSGKNGRWNARIIVDV